MHGRLARPGNVTPKFLLAPDATTRVAADPGHQLRSLDYECEEVSAVRSRSTKTEFHIIIIVASADAPHLLQEPDMAESRERCVVPG